MCMCYVSAGVCVRTARSKGREKVLPENAPRERPLLPSTVVYRARWIIGSRIGCERHSLPVALQQGMRMLAIG
eukprot:scaffold6237_cov135-Isochrysis_galbana.AAC.1